MKGTRLDWLVCLALLAAGLISFISVLAPTLLEGDPALYQYTPYVLGVTYPTGFPNYLLISKLWLLIFPFGSIAWRMNLFSAVCGSLALPLIYSVGRRVWDNRLAALTVVLIFATLRTYWRWATVAKVYTFNILLFSIVLWLAVRGPEPVQLGEGRFWRFLSRLDGWIARHRYKLGALALGIQIGGHNTTVLLIPGVLLLFWLDFKAQKARDGSTRSGWRIFLSSLPFFLIPASFYLYIPLRAEYFIAQYGREGAIARGLVADFYSSGWQGWLRYFSGAEFTGGVVSNWGDIPANLQAVYLPLLRQDFTSLGIALGLIGGLVMLWRQPRYFWPFLLIYLAPIPFVLTYGRGEQSAFLLTSDLAFAFFAGGSMVLAALIGRAIAERISLRAVVSQQAVSLVAFAAILVLLLWPQIQYNTNWINRKWTTANYDYWADVLNHPLDEGAGVMASWADLTSMWYMQQVEGRRTDLLGVYPPTEAEAAHWLAQDRSIYVGGPAIANWEPDLLARYQLIPWGRLVRLAPLTEDRQSLLPTLPQPQDATFGQRLHLTGADFAPGVDSGGTLYVYLVWEALDDLPEFSRYSLRLTSGDTIVAQKDDTLISGWFPLDYVPARQGLVGAYHIELPPGVLPGSYRLQLAVYERPGEEWPLADGSSVLDLGEVEVRFVPASTPPGELRINGELALDDTNFSVKRVRQGKGFRLDMLWRALKPPRDNYTLVVELVDQNGQVWRDWQLPAETASWRKAQQVRQQVDMTIPAEAPVEDEALQVRLRWQRPDGTALQVRRWFLPVGNSVDLPSPIILPKEDRLWEEPEMAQPLEAIFEKKAALIGVDLPAVISEPQTVPLTLYWQGRGDMRQVYHRFVHILDDEQQVVAQDDGVQAQGSQPTTTWAVGEYIVDPVEITLPEDLPPGTYSVISGLYLPPTGPRLYLWNDDGEPIGDYVTIGEIIVNKRENAETIDTVINKSYE